MHATAAAAAALALAVGALGCKDEPPPPEPVVRPIKMLTIGGGLTGTREYPGRLKAVQQADMAFEVSGRITEFILKEGQRAEEGAVLARLDPRDYENQLEQAKAAERNRRTYVGRIRQAHKTGAVSDQDLNDAQAQVEVAAAEVKIQQKALDDTMLRAPFDGIMSRKLVEDFANVQAKEPVLIFEDDSMLEIKVSVPERDMAGRRPSRDNLDEVNQRLQPTVVVTSLPDDAFPAQLKELATTADPTTRTFEATFQFQQAEDVVVLPGMTAKVRIQVGDFSSASEVSIPARAAVADDLGQPMVWIVDPDTGLVESRAVTLGELAEDQVIVTEGLNNGDTVAISGMSQLRPGMQVRPWERQGAAP
jgi:RND family efflux transporter MFP subunit